MLEAKTQLPKRNRKRRPTKNVVIAEILSNQITGLMSTKNLAQLDQDREPILEMLETIW